MFNSHLVTIENNTFAGNAVVKGVIYIEGDPDQEDFLAPGIFINSNTFYSNFAYFGTSSIAIKRYY